MAITSRDNRLVKEIRRLTADAKYRRESGRFAIEGARLCADAARSGVGIDAVLYTAQAAAAYPAQMAMLRRAAPGVMEEIAGELAAFMGDTRTPQGIFCLCRALDNRGAFDTIGKNGAYLALEDVRDPANVGGIVRTAEALGLHGLLLSSGCCDLYNPKALRASMGGMFRLPLIPAGDMAECLAILRGRGMTCWACVVDGEAVPIQRVGLGPGCVCVVGNEGAGLRPETAAACDGRLTIPMGGRAESLSAAMAAGIVLWEMMRPR